MIPTYFVLIGLGVAIRTGPVIAVEQEYCFKESTEMGICLGKARRDSLNKYTTESMMRCLECGETVRGDESCDELKALNNLEDAPSGNDGDEVVDLNNIDWHESFCEQYTECVESYCPKQCHHAQARFMDCVVLELECDIRCKDWNIDNEMMGDRMFGINDSTKTNHCRTMLGLLGILAMRIAG